MLHIVNIVNAIAADEQEHQNDMEMMSSMFINNLLAYARATSQIQRPIIPPPPLIIFNLDDQNVWPRIKFHKYFQ